MFDFITKPLNDIVKGVVNTVASPFTGILKSMGLDGIVSQLAGFASKIPGLGSTFGGLLAVVPDLINGKFDLGDAFKVAAVFAPPPVGPLLSMANVDELAGSVLGLTGPVDPNSTEGGNLLAAVQNLLPHIA
jgi:hypothetical protein